jgi:hypothetical protein
LRPPRRRKRWRFRDGCQEPDARLDGAIGGPGKKTKVTSKKNTTAEV